MKTSIVVAIADNYAIGKNNNLLWHLPADMKMFRELTTGHTVVMGRKTFQSLPNGPLPNRKNIVVSRTLQQPADNSYIVCDSLIEAMKTAQNENRVFIIGGAQLYADSLKFADTLHITWVKHTFDDADTFFPEIDFSKWNEVSKQEFKADEKNKYDYVFTKYETKGK